MGMRARAVARRDDDGARARMRVTNASAATSQPLGHRTRRRARMSSTREVRELLERAFAPCAELDVVDVSGECGSAFEVRVVSESFRDKSRIESHRAIHDALGERDGKDTRAERESGQGAVNEARRRGAEDRDGPLLWNECWLRINARREISRVWPPSREANDVCA